MNDLNNTETRRRLASRYIDADTTLTEERALRDFYAHTTEPLSDDERRVQALMTSDALSTAGDMALSVAKAREFDNLMSAKPVKKYKSYWWAAIGAAAAIVAILLVFPYDNTQVKVASPGAASAKIAARAVAADTAPAAAVSHTSDCIEVPQQGHELVTQSAQPATARAAATVNKAAPDSGAEVAETVQQHIDDLLAVANLHGAQVASYRLQPRGEATVVTATMADGSLAAYMVSCDIDNGSIQLIPIRVE